MAQFDVFANPVVAARRAYPLVVILQSDLIAAGDEKVVAPLAPRRGVSAVAGRLSPVVQIDETEYIVLVQSLTKYPARDLGRRSANLTHHREALLGAVDLLFYGI